MISYDELVGAWEVCCYDFSWWSSLSLQWFRSIARDELSAFALDADPMHGDGACVVKGLT